MNLRKGAPNSPPRLGGVAATSRKCREASIAEADGAVDPVQTKNSFLGTESTAPSAPNKDAARYLLDGAATPPNLGGELGAPYCQFIQTSRGSEILPLSADAATVAADAR